MRRTAVIAISLCVLGSCGQSPGSSTEPTEPRPLNGSDPAVVKLIEKRYASCLDQLDAGRVRFASDNVYTASADAGPLEWSALKDGKGGILTTPSSSGVKTLRTVGC